MPNCILRDCNNNTGRTKKVLEGITFHKFPRPGQEEREVWIEFVQENREDPVWLPSEHSTMCSKHFRRQDFYETPKGRRFLIKSAIPYKNPLSVTPQRIKFTKVYRKALFRKRSLHVKNEKLRQQNQLLSSRNRKLKIITKRLRAKLPTEALIDTENRLLRDVTAVETYIKSYKKSGQCNYKLACRPSVRKFNFPLNYPSEEAFIYPVKINNNISKDLQTESSWYGSFQAEPGFTEESFLVLDLQSSIAGKPLICSLVYDVMVIRPGNLFKNKHLGLVDYGTGPQEETATYVLVFMLVSLSEDWKIPVGYFLVGGICAEIIVKFITICLEKCHKVGVRVVSLTFKGAETNYMAAEGLGCHLTDPANMRTYFPHPCTLENVYIFIDSCHVLKMIRNTFESKRLFFDENNNKVKWRLLLNLNKLRNNEGLIFTNKLTPRIIKFRNQMMTTKLASQSLSMNLPKSLELCNKVLKSNQFLDNTGTINFITLMNHLFDVFNSKRYHFYGYKSHICSGNKENIFNLLNKVKSYILMLQIQVKQIRTIKRPNRDPRIIMKILKKRVIDSQLLTGFDCAIICIESLTRLYTEMIEEKKLIKSISTCRLSQEHLELFFGSIRKYSGNTNNNPDAIQFRKAYKKVLLYFQVSSSSTPYAIPLDNFSILTASSVDIINSTTSTNRFEDVEFKIIQHDNKIFPSDIQTSINCEILAERLDHESLTSYSKLIVGYMSGFVARKLAQDLKCEECIDYLLETSKLWHHKLISVEDMGGLCYSSEDLYQVCVKTEAFIRSLIKENGHSYVLTKYYNVNYIIAKTLELFLHSNIFESMSFHSLEQPGTFNHRVHLIRAAIEKYTIIRLQHETTSGSDLLTSMKWRKFRKLILFV